MICPTCGADLDADDAFCGLCGSARPAEGVACWACGAAELDPGEDFCGRCGQDQRERPSNDDLDRGRAELVTVLAAVAEQSSGAPGESDPDARFQDAEATHARLSSQRDSGQISQTEFESRSRELIILGEDGRYWFPAGAAGQWLVHDGQQWLPVERPRTAPSIVHADRRPVASETRRLDGHTDAIVCISFSPDGIFALSSGRDHTVRLWDVAGGTEIRCFTGHTGFEIRCGFLSDGERVISIGDDCTIRVWDMDTVNEVQRVDVTGPIYSSAASPDGRYALTGHDGVIHLWDVFSATRAAALEGHVGIVRALEFWPDGRYAVSGGTDGTVRLWDLASGREIRSHVHGAPVNGVVFSDDGTVIASCGGPPNSIRIWDGATGAERSQLQDVFTTPRCIAVSPDGTRLISNSATEIGIWNVETGQPMGELVGHTHNIWSLAFSPDGSLALSGSSDCSVRVWQFDEP